MLKGTCFCSKPPARLRHPAISTEVVYYQPHFSLMPGEPSSWISSLSTKAHVAWAFLWYAKHHRVACNPCLVTNPLISKKMYKIHIGAKGLCHRCVSHVTPFFSSSWKSSYSRCVERNYNGGVVCRHMSLVFIYRPKMVWVVASKTRLLFRLMKQFVQKLKKMEKQWNIMVEKIKNRNYFEIKTFILIFHLLDLPSSPPNKGIWIQSHSPASLSETKIRV